MEILGSPIVNGITLALAVIGIILAYVFYRRGRRSKELSWYVRSARLIEGYVSKFGELDVLWKGAKVDNVTVSRIIIWNSGTETIDRQDIATANPLRISTGSPIILDAKIVAANNTSS